MRHRKTGRKLNRNSSHRKAMFRNMVTSLFKYDKIQTTDAKAKELRIIADKMVTLAKRGDLHARRQALSVIREKEVVHKLFDEAKERFGGSAGGYTRIIKIGHRPGDAAPISLIELITTDGGKKKKKPAKKKTQPKAKPAKAVEAPKPVEEETKASTESVETPETEAVAEEKAEASPAAEDGPQSDSETSEESGEAAAGQDEDADAPAAEEDKKPSDT